ncbi:hypothetical protein [Lysobacter gummosus]|uniref:hypothetical protein n=1 Tax=Lysobacter gummosus TaxID=262324 RepID=UPI00363C0048
MLSNCLGVTRDCGAPRNVAQPPAAIAQRHTASATGAFHSMNMLISPVAMT